MKREPGRDCKAITLTVPSKDFKNIVLKAEMEAGQEKEKILPFREIKILIQEFAKDYGD